MRRSFRSMWDFAPAGAGIFVNACGSRSGPWEEGRGFSFEFGDAGDLGGGAFGVRRPLRFLAYKLGLDDDQVKQLAHVLDELKTERAQAAVDTRRTLSAFADAVAGDLYDEGKATDGAALRVEGAD